MPDNTVPGQPGLSAGRMPSGEVVSDGDDFTRLEDSALLARRAEMRAELERLPPASLGHAALAAQYDQSTAEIDDRARRAWAGAS